MALNGKNDVRAKKSRFRFRVRLQSQVSFTFARERESATTSPKKLVAGALQILSVAQTPSLNFA
jgi:hypothetical protein